MYFVFMVIIPILSQGLYYNMVGQLLSRPAVFLACIFAGVSPNTTVIRSDVGDVFRWHESSPLGMIVAGEFQARSVMFCASRCVSSHQSYYFTYDKNTTTCKCALTMAKEISSFLPPSERLFVHTSAERCDVNSGFAMIPLRGQQIVSDTVEKLEILNNIRREIGIGISYYLYIGLSDEVKKNVFVWADGRNMTVGERNSLFQKGEPHNVSTADCGVQAFGRSRLSDKLCATYLGFACEILLE